MRYVVVPLFLRESPSSFPLERVRLFGWTVGDRLFRVHLKDDNRRRFLALVRNFAESLDMAIASAQSIHEQLYSYLTALPSDLADLRYQGVTINDEGRLEPLPRTAIEADSVVCKPEADDDVVNVDEAMSDDCASVGICQSPVDDPNDYLRSPSQ